MKFWFGHLCWLLVGTCLAQEGQVFTAQKEFYLHGSTAVIGNNSLSNDAQEAFNRSDKVNDEFKMVYVDIDQDPSTYSSSAAELAIDENLTIVYAALYWAGTYNGDQSVKKYKDKRTYYKIKEERSHDPRMVKLGMPNMAYKDIKGELIFDASTAKNRMIKSYRPYVCMADVTAQLQEAGQRSGIYTVGNVSATEGYILGGSAAGWLLFIVYEDPDEPLQYITTSHGLEFVNKQPVDLLFSNFRTPKTGKVHSQITLAALEGDTQLKRDNIGIYNPETDTTVLLDNKVRASDNFFNSAITIDDQYFEKRNPNSGNTLGFDIAQMDIPNPDNTLIANDNTSLVLRLASRSDRFFIFFTSFQTSLSEAYSPGITPSTMPMTTAPDLEEDKAVAKESNTEKGESPNLELPAADKEEIQKVLNSVGVDIPALEKGYYIITNVFSSKGNAARWASTIAKRGYKSQVIQRPDNQLYYVFIDHGMDVQRLYQKLTEVRKSKDLAESWMLKINVD